jgi:hypothetical protein
MAGHSPVISSAEGRVSGAYRSAKLMGVNRSAAGMRSDVERFKDLSGFDLSLGPFVFGSENPL